VICIMVSGVPWPPLTPHLAPAGAEPTGVADGMHSEVLVGLVGVLEVEVPVDDGVGVGVTLALVEAVVEVPLDDEVEVCVALLLVGVEVPLDDEV